MGCSSELVLTSVQASFKLQQCLRMGVIISFSVAPCRLDSVFGLLLSPSANKHAYLPSRHIAGNLGTLLVLKPHRYHQHVLEHSNASVSCTWCRVPRHPILHYQVSSHFHAPQDFIAPMTVLWILPKSSCLGTNHDLTNGSTYDLIPVYPCYRACTLILDEAKCVDKPHDSIQKQENHSPSGTARSTIR